MILLFVYNMLTVRDVAEWASEVDKYYKKLLLSKKCFQILLYLIIKELIF